MLPELRAQVGGGKKEINSAASLLGTEDRVRVTGAVGSTHTSPSTPLVLAQEVWLGERALLL